MEGFEQANQYSSESTQSRGIVGLVIRSGLAKDETRANYILIGIAIISLILSIIIFSNTFSNSGPSTNTPPPPLSRAEILFILQNDSKNLPPELLHIPQSLIDQIPDPFYREDLPEDLIKILPPAILQLVPSKYVP